MFKTMIGALALAATLPAVAAETRQVRYDDLNLATPTGVQSLERRIDGAARDVCGVTGARDVGPTTFVQDRACMAAAKAKAASQVAALQTGAARGG